MYSQHGEDEAIYSLLRKRGIEPHNQSELCFVDIGCADGTTFSNTKALVESGWTGVCVDASPLAAYQCAQHNKDNPAVLVLCAGLAPSIDCANGPRVAVFHDAPGSLVSTFSPSHAERWAHAGPFRRIVVPLVGFAEIEAATAMLPREPGQKRPRLGVLSIDVEGVSAEVLEGVPLSWLTELEVICVEKDGGDGTPARAWAERAGWCVPHETPENLLLTPCDRP